MKRQIRTVATQQNNAQKGGVYVLRIATIMLAIVSWWATAQGMADYVFSARWQAYLASLAIQSILLGLNFYLPTFWRHVTSDASRWGLAMLSAVVLFCSSWFSYVYIVNHSYLESWDTISRLLVQSTYRQELYGALDYAEEYDDTLRDVLGNQIISLYSQSKEIEQNETQTIQPVDVSQDRVNYADNPEFAASREINTAIQALENALREGASASDRETAVSLISKLLDQVDSEITILETNIARTNAAIENAADSVRLAQNRLNSALAGTDTTALLNALNTANQNYRNQQNRLLSQEDDLADYQVARRLLQQYLSQLGISSSGTGTQISASLRDIQSNLLRENIDIESVEDAAREIFDLLQGSEDTLNTDDAGYQIIMNEIDRFIRDLQKYAEVKSSEQTLNKLVDNLQNESTIAASDWKTTSMKRLENLKSVIGSLPSYTGSDNPALRTYNRSNSIDKLDNALRKYISNHNAADQALIYLSNTYSALAWFSLLLAFFLDISAFITGFIIDIVDQRQAKRQLASDSEPEQIVGVAQDNFTFTPSTARRYVFLTGDFTKEEDRYYYQVLEGDDQTEIETQEEIVHPGFHVEVEGKFRELTPQELAFAKMPQGPRDGIYQNCYLQYSDGMLSVKSDPNEEYRYLTIIGDDIPVFQIRKNECIDLDIEDIPPQVWDVAILALNSKGTRVAAIYLMGR